MIYKQIRFIFCLVVLLLVSGHVGATDKYRCRGSFNTSSDYLHDYVINGKAVTENEDASNAEGRYLQWNGTRFHFLEDPVWIYAEYIGDTRTDVIYIEKDSLEAMFYSILPGLTLYANGKCEKVPPRYLEFNRYSKY